LAAGGGSGLVKSLGRNSLKRDGLRRKNLMYIKREEKKTLRVRTVGKGNRR
jgi:hypothetical protein